jgi:hypothetical protein
MPTGLDWVGPLRGLTGQHHTVGAVKYSVSNIADLRPRRSGIVLPAIRMNAERLGNMFGLLTVIDYRKVVIMGCILQRNYAPPTSEWLQ